MRATQLRTVPAPVPPQLPSACLHCTAREHNACGAVAPPDLAKLASISHQETFKNGHALFLQGDPATWAYNITSGSVRLTHTLRNGNRQVVGFMFPGDFLGFCDSGEYAFSAECIGTVKVCRFSQCDLTHVKQDLPRFNQRMLEIAISDLVSAQEQLAMLGRQTAVEKVASFLLVLSRKAASHGRPANPLHLPMTREDIGDFLGLAFETVSRCMARLEDEGLIALESARTVRINDSEALEDYSEEN